MRTFLCLLLSLILLVPKGNAQEYEEHIQFYQQMTDLRQYIRTIVEGLRKYMTETAVMAYIHKTIENSLARSRGKIHDQQVRQVYTQEMTCTKRASQNLAKKKAENNYFKKALHKHAANSVFAKARKSTIQKAEIRFSQKIYTDRALLNLVKKKIENKLFKFSRLGLKLKYRKNEVSCQ